MNNLKELEELKKRHIEYIKSLEYNRETANKKWTDSIDRADTEYFFKKKGIEDRKHINYRPVCNYVPDQDDCKSNYDCYFLSLQGFVWRDSRSIAFIEGIALNNNSFKNQEDAKQQEKINKSIIKVNKRIDELNCNFNFEYGEETKLKFEIHYNHMDKTLDISSTRYQQYPSKLKLVRYQDVAEQILKESTLELELIFEVVK